jgi:hypothetical protein
MNYLHTFLKAHIPSSFLFVRRECDVFDVRLVRACQMEIPGQARSIVITGGTNYQCCNPVTT